MCIASIRNTIKNWASQPVQSTKSCCLVCRTCCSVCINHVQTERPISALIRLLPQAGVRRSNSKILEEYSAVWRPTAQRTHPLFKTGMGAILLGGEAVTA